ncbi:hypothetical protein DFA_00355 [Cavenderia fasciculata]|uniref:Uncharacterized protein n=1 Tax=Cavenderia fasciculata TaxID=261658 RepID=F4PRE2_CACFS|nr:uncharacterized protein DFA_00355 [Cavenderia fasciculata]EGG20494.1 hypothetical protein DFA_00355 [Cavenderia fasciculata]|eukprot:XP_004358344.1 hypothetical protein DFA_00355 [Cavenderia fasciculata]
MSDYFPNITNAAIAAAVASQQQKQNINNNTNNNNNNNHNNNNNPPHQHQQTIQQQIEQSQLQHQQQISPNTTTINTNNTINNSPPNQIMTNDCNTITTNNNVSIQQQGISPTTIMDHSIALVGISGNDMIYSTLLQPDSRAIASTPIDNSMDVQYNSLDIPPTTINVEMGQQTKQSFPSSSFQLVQTIPTTNSAEETTVPTLVQDPAFMSLTNPDPNFYSLLPSLVEGESNIEFGHLQIPNF